MTACCTTVVEPTVGTRDAVAKLNATHRSQDKKGQNAIDMPRYRPQVESGNHGGVIVYTQLAKDGQKNDAME